MERMYQDYKDVAEFFIVYISEAHAIDDRRPAPYAKELGITEHKTLGERCLVAGRLTKDKKLTIPCLVDGMDNAVEEAYRGWPDRVYVVNTEGTLVVAAARGPWGFKPALEATGKWLAQFKATGSEPPPVERDPRLEKYQTLQRELYRTFETPDYDKALGIATQMHELFPRQADNVYNIACIHCLLGHKERAFDWLAKAIEAGYDDAEHLAADEDFKSIRDEKRFQDLVERLRAKSQPAEQVRVRAKGTARLASADADPKEDDSKKAAKKYRGRIGADSKKIKVEGKKTYVWAAGDPSSPDSKWYDFTGSPIPADELQFGIGQDRIPSIDDPLFVAPDDPRLLEIPPSPYRRDERPKTNDEIMVIGFANGDDVRAYPAALLDHHELVNDRVGGKPVTVGW